MFLASTSSSTIFPSTTSHRPRDNGLYSTTPSIFTSCYFHPVTHSSSVGDWGFMDCDGFIQITGRIKEIINRGGEKISPIEIDAVLLSHPGIKTAVTFGAPDPKYGEIVHCVVIPREEVRNVLTEEDVIRFGLERMAPFKVPVKVFFAEHVPVTATGKVQRKMIAELFSGASEK
eukprot:TRINITY_DN111_c0_g1_i21.p2 TRINITY_DN111_c0_g1~~TRINITY_DN111_c0_g1_i21.p2  ORF type:complete len:174 (+),score=47.57 TRINITY_DN111_c0_g1_i21:1768-2289(+)